MILPTFYQIIQYKRINIKPQKTLYKVTKSLGVKHLISIFTEDAGSIFFTKIIPIPVFIIKLPKYQKAPRKSW